MNRIRVRICQYVCKREKSREADCSTLPGYADCDRSSIRLLTSENSETNESVLLPASVAASISVLNNIAVAISALHSRQHFSVLPGSSNNSSRCPQTLHGAIESFSVPFGPFNMTVPFLPLSTCLSTARHCIDLLRCGGGGAVLPITVKTTGMASP